MDTDAAEGKDSEKQREQTGRNERKDCVCVCAGCYT